MAVSFPTNRELPHPASDVPIKKHTLLKRTDTERRTGRKTENGSKRKPVAPSGNAQKKVEHAFQMSEESFFFVCTFV